MIITLSGKAGSGKSTVGKALARQLGWEFISVGNFIRQHAEEKYGMSINEFQEFCQFNPQIDRDIDDLFTKKCREAGNAIVDWRLGFHFIPEALSVFLDIDDLIAAERIEGRKKEFSTVEGNVLGIMQNRNSVMRVRFQWLYGADFTDHSNYSLCINTGQVGIDDTADLILDRCIAMAD